MLGVVFIMEIVMFKNGKYGIRKRTWFDKLFGLEGKFRDFKPILTKWRRSDCKYFHDCQLDSLEKVKEQFEIIKNGVVKEVVV